MNSSETFTITAVGNAAGGGTLNATISSPDANPASAGTTITVLTAPERFVQALYLDDLGRAGAVADLDWWVGVLNGPGGSRAVVAAGIAGSFEARDHLVKTWYQTYLGRPATNGEELGLVNLLQSETQEQVLSQLLGGAEFYHRAQLLASSGTADQRYVQSLFLLLLNRTASASEVAAWANVLPQLGNQGAALAIEHTTEYRTDLVAAYYSTLLHRQAAAADLSWWALSSLDAASILIGFESSAEFYSNG